MEISLSFGNLKIEAHPRTALSENFCRTERQYRLLCWQPHEPERSPRRSSEWTNRRRWIAGAAIVGSSGAAA
jgi:hypothetical protein